MKQHSKPGSGHWRPLTSHQEASSLTSLEVQSSPIQLATRSLSARALTSTAGQSTDSDSAQRSTQSSRSAVFRKKITKSSGPQQQRGQASGRGVETSRKRAESSRKRVESSRKRAGSSRKRVESSTKGVETLRKGVESSRKGVEPVKLPVERGFNIADHLRNSEDNDRLRRSASSDVQKILQDISSVMRSVSPSLQPTPGGGEEKLPKPAGRRAHLRSKVAANFSLPVNQQEEGPDGPPPHPMDDGVELERKLRRNSRRTGQVPYLNIGDAYDPSNIGPPNGVASAPVGVLGAKLEGGHSGEPTRHHDGSNGGQGLLDVQEISTAPGGHGVSVAPGYHTPEGLSTAPRGHTSQGIYTAAEPAPTKSHGVERLSRGMSSQGVELSVEERAGLGPASGAPQSDTWSSVSHAVKEDEAEPDAPQGAGESSPRASSQAMEVRSLLEEKRAGLSRSRLEELERAQNEVETRERKRAERDQRRAAKMKADRMAAIAELRKKREEKRLLQERIAQEEIVSEVGGGGGGGTLGGW